MVGFPQREMPAFLSHPTDPGQAMPLRLSRLPTSRHSASPSRHGAALVELVLVSPVFLLILLGMMEFGQAMRVGRLLADGARQGAEQAVQPGATNLSVQHDVESFLTDRLSVPSDDLDVSIRVTPAPGHPDPDHSLAASLPRDLVTVTVTVPFEKAAGVSGNFLNGTTLRGECALRRESPARLASR